MLSPHLVSLKKYQKPGIVQLWIYAEFYIVIKQKIDRNMLSRIIAAEIKWIILAFVIALVLVSSVNGILVTEEYSGMVKPTFFGLNLFMEILVFFVFSTFVVFGIKGFFEMYSQRVANVIIFITGVSMTVAIFILTYQILF